MAMIKFTGKRTSDSYRYTVDMATDESIAITRRSVKVANLYAKADAIEKGADRYTRLSIRVRPRLGADSPFAGLYKVGAKHWRRTSQDIRPEHGSRFDVYVYDNKVKVA
jgi:hypothetical protein